MEYKKYECDAYNIYTIKTDRFKHSQIEVVFRNKLTKENVTKRGMLCDILQHSTKKYNSYKKLKIELEELYNAKIGGVMTRVGPTVFTNYFLTFLNPEYTEDSMLEESIKMLFEMLMNPNVTDGKFDETSFKIVKNNYKADIESQMERPQNYSIKQMLIHMDEDAPSSINVNGYLEDLEEITEESLVKTYEESLNSDLIDIFVIGNLDMDEVVSIIDENFKSRVIKSKKMPLYANSKIRKKVQEIFETGDYTQGYLILGLNLDNLTELERNIIVRVYNCILGGSSLDSKLSKYLREENSLCYNTASRYSKWDNGIIITAWIDEKNYNLAKKLMLKALKEMENGDFDDEVIENAKKSLISSLNMAKDSPNTLLANYIFKEYDNLPDIETRIKQVKTVSKKDVVTVAKKVKLNTVYLLSKGGKK